MIGIVDFGSQLAHLISRRLKDLGIESQMVQPEKVMDVVGEDIKGLIFSGGPSSVYEDGAPTIDKKVYDLGLPILGICYGWQLMALHLGGSVESSTKEYGVERLKVNGKMLGIDGEMGVVMSHGDSVIGLPEGFAIFGSTEKVKYAGVAHVEKRFYGVQFHPEADHTENGSALLETFADECGEEVKDRAVEVDELIGRVQEKVGDEKVVLAVSGGVDSSVAAAVIAKAIGEQLTVVYVKSGLMRPGTQEWVEKLFTQIVPADLRIIDAEDRFFVALEGMTDPEKKRKTIGKLYVDIFNEVAIEVGASFLGQGTIYSDVIESKGTENAVTIKSHHNVGGLPKEMKLTLLEPLREMYKDEVRSLGRALGLSEELVMQQPFPGPGYAIRVRGAVTRERVEQVKIADQIVMEEVQEAGLWDKVFQCFAVMTGTESTAVKGDARVFAEVVGIRAYESNDVMTSQAAELSYDLLKRMVKRIVSEVPNVSRVVYDVTDKPPATMEWE